MNAPRVARVLAIALAVLLLLAFSPLTDSDTGWRNTMGDIIWTAMFAAFLALIAVGGWHLLRRNAH